MKRKTLAVIFKTLKASWTMTLALVVMVAGAIGVSLLPPLVLERIINHLSTGESFPVYAALIYFGFIALAGLLESVKEILLSIMGQKITKGLRKAMNDKVTRLSAKDLISQEPGVIVSRFIGDVDTVEKLFTSGIISMAADLCKVVSIFVIMGRKNFGLALIMLFVIPVIFIFTRYVQKSTLKAQLENRKAIAKVSNHVPETIQNIRTVHTLEKEKYMEKRYGDYIGESYLAIEKTNFFDAIYSPVILIFNAVITALVMILAASGVPVVKTLFGMTVGTSVAMVSYIASVFAPLESIGMEIQTIQSAVAGVHRIDEFLSQEECWETDKSVSFLKNVPCVELKGVSFGYVEEQEVLHNLSFIVDTGENVTLTGRTGSGKSTIFKLLMGLYKPQKGNVYIYGQEASLIPNEAKRSIFGYVEQTFCPVPGSIGEQISLFDENITQDMIENAAKLVGIHDVIAALPEGYNTEYNSRILSQGQKQLLSIARAIAAQPKLLLLDEITANLDADTEKAILEALKNASKNRTVISISHRIYEKNKGRQIDIFNM